MLGPKAKNKRVECDSLTWEAWIAHLRGEVRTASAIFVQAETEWFSKQREEISSTIRYRYSLAGVLHADHLRRKGDTGYARRVTESNLDFCWYGPWIPDLSRCYRVLGDLDADAGQHDGACTNYDHALKIARNISSRDTLIEALLARGRWAARLAANLPQVGNLREVDQAFSDLNEALGYAVDGGYRIYEADIRVALAWAHLAAGDPAAARAEAERAQRMSADMGYHWGQVDAAEVLAAVR